ncbi:MAG: SMC-Scp complex subunit ScpB [Planctomycetales bacterium]|nr:SMC-Scp complex subunit ScpB [Planctomycetales bacterium]
MARLEAALFVAREPVSSRRLAQLASLPDGTRARSLARQLAEIYDLRESAFQIEEVAGGFQLLARRAYASWINRLEQPIPTVRLSSPALETLAVIAYRQPVLRVEIEAIRGVQCGEILRQLMDRDMVRITGRSHDLGRPFVYGTTRRFLQAFGLRHIEELPRREDLLQTSFVSQGAVAKDSVEGQDSGLSQEQSLDSVSEENAEVICRADNSDSELDLSPSEDEALRSGAPLRAYGDDDEFYDDDDDGDDDYDEDEDEYDDEDDDYDDDEEDDWEDEEELDGDWEEVEDDELDDDDDEDDDEDDEDDEDEWDDDEDEEYYDDDEEEDDDADDWDEED